MKVIEVILAIAIILMPFPISQSTIDFEKVKFSSIRISGIKEIKIDLEGTNSRVLEVGKPILPMHIITRKFPIGTKILRIDCIPNEIKTIKIHGKSIIAKGSCPFAKIEIKNEGIFPKKWYSYHIGVGIENGRRLIFLTIELHPVRYNAIKNEILYAKNFDISIDYILPKNFLFTKDKYDFLIITPSEWKEALIPLKEQKENHGIKTIIVCLDDIYNGKYFATQGRDEPEKIKYFIKDAIEQWGIKYVLLVGSHEKMPVRYTNLHDGLGGTGYISDLYYADVYKYEDGKIVFEDWDSNGNGIFAEWDENNVDVLDLYPDVYIGRLPCRNEFEVKTVVSKIISYEENTYGKKWFKRMIVCGGDTFADHYYMDTHFYEGELITQEALKYMKDFEAIKLWGTKRNLHTINIWLALNKGAGFVYFSGHGTPFLWVAYSPYYYPLWIGLWGIWNLPFLFNGEKLPVVVLSGCATAQFNLSIECISWWFVRKINGGSIATLGYTASPYGGIGDQDDDGIPDCIEYKCGYLEIQFFRLYGEENTSIIGNLWGNALTDYLNKFSIDWNGEIASETQKDCQIIEKWILFGDPTLKIGGYKS